MSLKSFHILFISLAALLCFGFCYWAFSVPPAEAGGPVRLVGILTGFCGVALTAYGFWFRKKSRRIIV